jgi:hypothetical protein
LTVSGGNWAAAEFTFSCWIEYCFCFHQTNPARFAIDNVFSEFNELARRQSLSDEIEAQLVVMDVLALRRPRLKYVSNKNPGMKVSSSGAAISDFPEDDNLPRQRDLDLSALPNPRLDSQPQA